jgi:small subunit ribosomal protein S6
MRCYELTYLISPELSEKDLKGLEDKITTFIQGEGGRLNETNLLMKRKLAYPIKRKTEAFLATVNFHFQSEKIGAFEKKLKAENQILRYLILTKKIPSKIKVAKPRRKIIKKPKVELREIEKKLEEILDESR